jgi:two-component sensor histidine kinase/CheY-like chemotaxis protein
MMGQDDKVNILLVDDQPAKLLSYEVILRELDENLLVAASGREALECLLKNDIAVVLLDVCMPELDGFELAAMIRDHPRFQKTAMIFISAIQVADIDHLRGYAMGAVDYVPVPVIPEVLRAKVKVFAELYRKTRQLERLNAELEERVRARTAELEASTARLLESEQRRSLAIAAGNMGSWDWDWISGDWIWDEGQYRIFGVDPKTFAVDLANIKALLFPDDVKQLSRVIERFSNGLKTYETEFRLRRPSGEVRWCIGSAAASLDGNDRVIRVSGVTIDITERKRAEQRQSLLSREVDHRGKNALALVQSIVRLTRADSIRDYCKAVEGRIAALARVHTILSLSSWEGAELSRLIDEELAPFITKDARRVVAAGPKVRLEPSTAQTLALALHELATNAAKYGALSSLPGRITVSWELSPDCLELEWKEEAGPHVQTPLSHGFGTKSVIASIETQLGGRALFDWRPEGLCCQLSVPIPETRDRASSLAAAKPGQGSGEAAALVAGQRIRDRASN